MFPLLCLAWASLGLHLPVPVLDFVVDRVVRGLTPRSAATISRQTMELRAVRGMKDILPDQVVRWQDVLHPA
ncbi:MAG: hypothetical protein DRI90_23320, partial [Deltaproteobacteria bacterium]